MKEKPSGQAALGVGTQQHFNQSVGELVNRAETRGTEYQLTSRDESGAGAADAIRAREAGAALVVEARAAGRHAVGAGGAEPG